MRIIKFILVALNILIIALLCYAILGIEVSMTYDVHEAYLMGETQHCIQISSFEKQLRFEKLSLIVMIGYLIAQVTFFLRINLKKRK